MFVNNTDCQILISTDALKVGNDFPNVDDVIILNPESPEDVLQMGGRAGRKQPYSNPGPRAICYYTQSTMKRANTVLENGKDEQNSSDQNYSRHGKMTVQMAKLILTGCITAELDSQFGNPAEDSRCFCESCLTLPTPTNDNCRCSCCQPETPLPPIPRESACSQRPTRGPMATRVSMDMRDYGSNALRRFRFQIWKKSQSPRLCSLPPAALLHDNTISGIFDVFSQLRSVADLSPYVNGFLQGHEQSLLAEIEELRKKFGRMNIGLDPDESSSLPSNSYDNFFASINAPEKAPTYQSPLSANVEPSPVPKLTIRIPPLAKRKLSNASRPRATAKRSNHTGSSIHRQIAILTSQS
ncbi:hypothetical protein F5890DRAFT_1553140 [Lentinula detonsa]|uniref:Helicase C-terminal domain-containing protein n=1 Tax=Lentinula detonsa TaxID=2804962 RepID=A0AA38Q141_9AGAR|nr:hypothetical protein F5890DRAFT_1553140 [Lentinula detonsa]